ncbi:MAG: cation diffusion facilitator family transporter [Candidatus Lernaella stagnicola]|nr:cation diffusion facilitator family transporter [Candidatus Lernaella stagnicola]
MKPGGNKKIIYAALAANFAIMISKFFAAAVTRSTAMFAEALHSLADTGNQVLLLVGLKRAQKPADAAHPFGYGKENYFWAFVVAITMFVVGSVVSVWQGVEKVIHPHELESIGWGVGVCLAGIVFEGASFLLAANAISRDLRGRSFWQYVRASKEPVTITVFLEDSAALLGLVLALLGLLGSHFLGIPQLDGAASIAIGLLLACVAAVLSIETKSLLVGESVLVEDREAILAALRQTENVVEVMDLKTMHLGPRRVLVAAQLHLADGLETDQIEQLLDDAEAAVRARLPIVAHCYLEVEGE